METFTELFGFSKFDDLDEPGAAKLNANWDNIDKALIPDGSSFPSTFPVNGRFVKTNDGLYKNTGTNNTPVWTKILGTPPGVILADGSVPFTGDQSLGGKKLTNLHDPVAAQDAATKNYVDTSEVARDYVDGQTYLRQYFADNSTLPPTKVFEDLYDLHGFDFNNLNGMSHNSLRGGQAFAAGAAPANIGWDIGSAKNKVRFGLCGMRAGVQALGIFMADAVPAAATPAGNIYLLQLNNTNGHIELYKAAAGSFSILGHFDDLQVDGGLTGKDWSLSLYWDLATHGLQADVRYGQEGWFDVISATDSLLSSVRAVGIWFYSSSGDFVINPPAFCFAN